MDQLAVQLGAIGALVAVLVSLVAALRTGSLVPGKTVDRLVAAHETARQREQRLADDAIAEARAQTQQWRDAHLEAAESLRTALDANDLLSQQADRLVSGTELTQRLIESLRARVGP